MVSIEEILTILKAEKIGEQHATGEDYDVTWLSFRLPAFSISVSKKENADLSNKKTVFRLLQFRMQSELYTFLDGVADNLNLDFSIVKGKTELKEIE